MGIPKFFGRFILGKYKDIVAKNTLPFNDKSHIDTVEFDVGGILHHTAQIVFSYGPGYDRNRSRDLVGKLSTPNGVLELEREFCIKVTDEIEKLVKAFIEEVNPKYKKIGNLVIAMDGVAPFAKIIQQRTRRYRTGLEEEKKGVNVDILPSWDSNSITPGTSFVDKFDRHMRGWITEDNIRNLVYNKIIFSSYRKRGEGEHKLFGFRRDGLYNFDEEIKTTDRPINICYGSDADLILLNLKDETENVYIVRDKDVKVNPKNRLFGTQEHGIVLDVDALRDIIVDEMTGRTKKDNISKYTYYSVVRDFILITFFLGNDFLPKVFCFSDLTTSLTEFMKIYNKNIFNGGDNKEKGKQIASGSGFLSREDGAIEWDIFASFMKKIQKLESKYLLILGKAQKKDVRPDENMENNSLALDVAITMNNVNSSRTREVETEYSFDETKFRNKWYNLVLGPRTEAMRVFLAEHDINYVSESSSEEMYKLYLTGLQWVLLYYVRGTLEVNKFWSYTYTQAPMMSDIYSYTKKMLEEGEIISVSKLLNKSTDQPFGPVHQLLSVMPPKSKNLLPKPYEHLTSGLGKLSYIAPNTFGIDYESASVEHEGLAILPSINPFEIIRVVNSIPLGKKINKDLLGTTELDTVIVKGVRTDGMKYSEAEIRALRKKGYDFINRFGKPPPKTSYKKRDSSSSPSRKKKQSTHKKRDNSPSPPKKKKQPSHKKRNSSSSPSRKKKQSTFKKKPYKKKEELSMKVQF